MMKRTTPRGRLLIGAAVLGLIILALAMSASIYRESASKDVVAFVVVPTAAVAAIAIAAAALAIGGLLPGRTRTRVVKRQHPDDVVVQVPVGEWTVPGLAALFPSETFSTGAVTLKASDEGLSLWAGSMRAPQEVCTTSWRRIRDVGVGRVLIRGISSPSLQLGVIESSQVFDLTVTSPIGVPKPLSQPALNSLAAQLNELRFASAHIDD